MTLGEEFSNREFDIKDRLLDLEILYLANLKPRGVQELHKLLVSTFGLDVTESFISSRLHYLVTFELVRKTAEQMMREEACLFSLTPKGAKVLEDGIQRLSEIALTMQLSLTQPLIIG